MVTVLRQNGVDDWPECILAKPRNDGGLEVLGKDGEVVVQYAPGSWVRAAASHEPEANG